MLFCNKLSSFAHGTWEFIDLEHESHWYDNIHNAFASFKIGLYSNISITLLPDLM